MTGREARAVVIKHGSSLETLGEFENKQNIWALSPGIRNKWRSRGSPSHQWFLKVPQKRKERGCWNDPSMEFLRTMVKVEWANWKRLNKEIYLKWIALWKWKDMVFLTLNNRVIFPSYSPRVSRTSVKRWQASSFSWEERWYWGVPSLLLKLTLKCN